MKFVKSTIALALVAFTGSFGVVHANGENTVQTNVSVTAYVAAGLTVGVTPLEFGHVVKPASGAGPNTVILSCSTGNVIYDPTSGSPSGTASNAQNANVTVTPDAGSLTIGGEANYAISVSVGNGGTPANGVTFIPKIATVGGPEVTGTLPTSLDGTGAAIIGICGTLEVTDAASASSAVNLQANVTVNYR